MASFTNNMETRVLFMGEPGCGKRSLLHYYIFDQIVEDETEEQEIQKSEAKNFIQQNEFIKEIHVENKTLSAHFFVRDITEDQFGEFSESKPKFDCYVVLFDMGLWPESGNRARKLFNQITSHKKIMVGCKSDLFSKNRKNRTHCVPCSVVHTHNIDNVFDQITEILQFQDVTVPPLRTPRGDPDLANVPRERRSRNVKKLLRVVGRLRSTTHSNQSPSISSGGTGKQQAILLPSLQYEPDVDREYEFETPRGGKTARFKSDEEDLSWAGPRSETDFDGDAEAELPDDFLDNCDEKSLLNAANVVDSKQLLQAAWRQNIKTFQNSLKTLKASGANFRIHDPVNSGGDTILHELVRKPGWIQSLQVILQSNVLTPNEITQLVNTKNYAGNTSLHIVASRGVVEYLNILFKSNVDVLSENERGKTALLVAIEMNKKDIVERLVQHNKEIILKNDNYGVSAYELAIDLGYYDIADILKSYFENVTPPTVLKDRALRQTLKDDFFVQIREEETDKVFEFVKDYPFLVHETDLCGRTPLHVAVLGRSTSELPELLLARDANIDQVDQNGNTPLHWAASHKAGYPFAKYLIQNNAKVDIPNNDGNYPLHMAVFSNNFKLLQYILGHCNPTAAGLKKANSDKNTPLHIICAVAHQSSHLDSMITLMTEKHAETNAVNSRNETPLHIAAAAGCARIHPSLCDQLNARDIFGNTPLLSAARAMNLIAVQHLLDMGSTLHFVNKDNENILHLLALSSGTHLISDDLLRCTGLLKKLEKRPEHRETIKQLLNASTLSSNETPLFYAARAKRLNLVKFFIRRGDDKACLMQNIAGDTPLHVAVKQADKAIVDHLIRKYSIITQANKEGYTPLHFCCSPTHVAISDRLLKKLKSADLFAVTSEGLSPLHLAAQAGNLHLAQKLVEKTSRSDRNLLTLRTQHDNTALIYAMSNNHSKVASFLAKKQNVNFEGDTRPEFRKEPFPHLYPFLDHEKVNVKQKIDIFSATYILHEGKLHDENILILEANSASSAAVMAHEIAIMSMIGNHPNVQRLLGASSNRYCYLPYLSNATTLDSILMDLMVQKETCDILQILTIAEGIANGMKCLHTATVSKPSIIHNALTPSAILIDDQNAKLSSFGTARVHFSEADALNDSRELVLPSMNDIRYLAPEVVRGEAPNKKSDIFSFGIILWQLCTTKIPYSDILMSDLIAHLRKGVDRPSLAEVDSGLIPVIESCWHKVPSKRPTFEEIYDRLNSVHVKNVEALGRNLSTQKPMLSSTKPSPFPCCKPREFQIMNKLKKNRKDLSNSSLYLCTFERIVCVAKMWPPNQSQQEQTKSSLQIFTMKALCECDHIVRYIYSDTDKNGNKCLFMEYMNKGTVAQCIVERKTANAGKGHPFTAKEIINYALPIAKALHFMQTFSTIIVHQDIQAKHVLISNREGNQDFVKLSGFSAMHSLQKSEEHQVYQNIEGFGLYLYQLLTLTTRVKNNWKSQVQKLQASDGPLVPLLHSCLDPIDRPSSLQLVESLEVIKNSL